jgi:Flp pilus assembly protein TadG
VAIFPRFAVRFVALMLALALLLLISVQAASHLQSQPTYGGAAAQANAQNVASHFTSTVNAGRTVTDSDTGKSTFFIGSASQKVISETHQAAPVPVTPVPVTPVPVTPVPVTPVPVTPVQVTPVRATPAQTTSHFTSTVNPGRYITDSESGKSTFFIDSISQKVTSKKDQAAPVQATPPVQAAPEAALDQATIDRSNGDSALRIMSSDEPPSFVEFMDGLFSRFIELFTQITEIWSN